MKHPSLLKTLALACGVALSATAVSSCSSTLSPVKAADRIGSGSDVYVFSSNDASSPSARHCNEAGQLPERAARGLRAWLKNATIQHHSSVYPQYYLTVPRGNGKQDSVWAICSDGHGNLVGVLIPRDGVPAWDLPNLGDYRVYVCDTVDRKDLSKAIMDSLADAGYDSYRIESRKSSGLTQRRFLLSKPMTDEEAQAERARLQEAYKRAQEAKAAHAASGGSVGGDDDFVPSDLDLDLGIDDGGDDASGSSDEVPTDDTTDLDL